MARSTSTEKKFFLPLAGKYLVTPEQNAFVYFMLIVVVEGLTKVL